jgi:DNA polymerase-3 subunit beta
MQLSLTREALLSQIQLVSRAISSRVAIPSLSGVLLTLNGNGLQMRATDLELGVEVKVQASSEGEGAVVLPGRLLADVVRSLPAGEVSLAFRAAERDVEIRSGSARIHLRTLSADDFPSFPSHEGEPLVIPAQPFVETVDRVVRAASRDETRPILTGVQVSAAEQALTMVATDSYRLAVKRTQLEQPIERSLEAIVPARSMAELTRVATGTEAERVEVWLAPNQAVFRVADVVLYSRLIDGQFPDHTQLLPETFEHEVRMPRGEFLDVVRRVSNLAQRNAPLRLSFAEGELTLSAETPDVGDARESMPVAFSGDPLEIGFNPDFLREGLESLPSDEMTLKLISPLRPGLIEPVGADDFSYLVMPIRLDA